jgi:general secretion pathway protein J
VSHAPGRRLTRATRHARTAGFTLLEVLIALAIMATLAVTAYRALSGMLDGEARVAQERDRWRDLDLFFARFEHDVGHMLPRPYSLGDIAFPAVFLRGDALAFVRGAAGEPPQRIGYRFREGTIELLYWQGLDAPAASEPAAYALASDLAGWHVRFANREGLWLDSWGEAGPQQDDAPLPRAVHIALDLTDGTRVERVFALR